MKREKLNSLNERDILVGLIVSDEFCREVAPIMNPRLLEIDYARTVASWVIDYFKKFEKAPAKDVVKLYRAHCEELNDEALQDNVLSFIEKCNKDYETLSQFNAEYAIQQAISYLKSRSLKNLAEDIESHLLNGNIDKAEHSVVKYKKVEQNSGESVSLLDDTETVLEAYTSENEKLFELPGAYGRLVGTINREDFIGFLAPMKAGKTWQLIDVGVEAVKNSLKVVFFSLEMSRTAMIKRFWSGLSGQFTEDVEIENYPYFDEVDSGDKKYILKHRSYTKKASSVLDIEKKQKSLKRMFRGGSIRIFSEPAYSLTVEKLDMKLDELEQDGFIPDVIIIDYADIMSPSEKGEYRNQLDGIWKRLRALAQARKCAVFTASQTNRGALSREVEVTDIAEDVRKLAHVTSMVSISKTDTYKKNSIAVLSQLAIREGEPELRKVVCTQCLSIGRPVLESRWKDEVCFDFAEDDDEEENKEIKRSRK